MDGMSATPAGLHLFDVNETNLTLLDDGTSQIFHHFVAKLLFLCKQTCPDIQPGVAFLTTRVQAPDQDDHKKLSWVIKYLHGSVDMPLTLEANSSHIIKWINSFTVHHDMKSHTGSTMSLGKGTMYSTSLKQCLVTKSSIEVELVSVNDVMPQVLWTCFFLEAQGFKVADSTIYQDNQSAILLEKHGRGSSSKHTQHINICYFFVTDWIGSGELSMQYCPMANMISDFFTKPLQGSVFHKLHTQIMNIDPGTYQLPDHRSMLENPESATHVMWANVVRSGRNREVYKLIQWVCHAISWCSRLKLIFVYKKFRSRASCWN